jgi:tRNA-specific 2-thiouridylase
MSERVVVAMSGGVDSSVAAALLVEQGYEVVGLMLRLWSDPAAGGPAANRCCTPDAQALAGAVADRLGIAFYVVDAQAPFKRQIVDFWVAGYQAGRTPNPCFECNRHIRFGFLLNYARSLGAQRFATGHYARVRPPAPGADEGYQLLRGADRDKDQSYVLHVLGQAELAAALFPVGDYTKAEVRALARERGLPVAAQRDSQDLCFLGDGDYRAFLQRHAPEALRPGPVVDLAGRPLGEHAGLPLYTIGQRKGLPVQAREPLYVIAIEPERNTLVVGPRAALERRALIAEGMHYVAGRAPAGPVEVTARVRYKGAELAARLTPLEAGHARIDFAAGLQAITPGQGVVCYDGERVLGGGIIVASEAAAREPASGSADDLRQIEHETVTAG